MGLKISEESNRKTISEIYVGLAFILIIVGIALTYESWVANALNSKA